MTEERPQLRIGTAERTAALRALDEHLAAGRLQAEEYGERSALAANAVTAPELAALFDDLPAPHPDLPAPVMVRELAGSSAHTGTSSSRRSGWVPPVLLALPVVAVALFLVTRSPVWFVLIPIVAVLLYAGQRRDEG
jgi:Domain of unknown function (DUF1707)